MTKDDVVELFDRNLDAIFTGLEEVQFVDKATTSWSCHDEPASRFASGLTSAAARATW